MSAKKCLKVEKDELIGMFMCGNYKVMHWMNVLFESNKNFTDWFSSSGQE